MLEKIRSLSRHFSRLMKAAPVLRRHRRDLDLKRVMRSYSGAVPLCLFSEPFLWVRMLINSKNRYRRPDQRPHAFYMPELPARPFGEPDATSHLLASHAEEIVREFTAIVPEEVTSPSIGLTSGGNWNTFPLVRAAKRFDDNIRTCPKTWSVVEQCPLPKDVRGGVYFSVLDPGTKIEPHCGPSNLKYRYHVTVKASEGARIRSGPEWRTWEAGQCLILDDSFDHEVEHNGAERRVVLIVDCWHPDLTDRERAFLTELHQCWNNEHSETPNSADNFQLAENVMS